MAMIMILFMFMFLSVHNVTFAFGQVVSLAKKNCPRVCGNETIPYPFGIGKGCFLEDWFEIECRNTSESTGNHSKPYMKKLGIEVLHIALPDGKDPRPVGIVRVNIPIHSSGGCQGARPAGAPVSLTGSTFVFSQEKNWFTTAGCGSKATLSLTTTGTNQLLVDTSDACSSNCSSTCCQSSLPAPLSAFNVTFNSTGARGGCGYAFLVEKGRLDTSSCDYSNTTTGSVPAILEWSVLDYKIPGLTEKERSVGFFFSCGSDLNQNQNQTLRCYCDNGYQGNPYLERKCEDIDECLDSSIIRCNGTSKCENFGGSFRCVAEKSQISMMILGLGLGLGLLILASASYWSYKLIKKRNKIKKKKHFFKRNGGLVLQQQLSSSQGNVEKTNIFTSKELEKATDRFNSNRVLGQGGQGTVYKGMLPDGRIVAVKKSKIGQESEIEPFINEVVILSQINHRNIVKLLGCCLETEVPLLVYEFVPNGTLSHYLHDKQEEFQVSWKKRLQLATEVACALSYLHSSASIPIFHRDIKSSNILLDDKFRAKIADFGTSRSVDIDKTHLTTLVHGTFGYLDPEYFQTSQFTDKSDVYSFGVVLVELLTGQRAISATRSQEGRSLAAYFMMTMERDELFEILDAKVVGQGKRGQVFGVANLAKRCLNLNGRNRPTMREVTKELEGIASPEKPPEEGFSGDERGFEEVELVRTREVEPWDVGSSSGGVLSPDSVPSRPLLKLSTRTW